MSMKISIGSLFHICHQWLTPFRLISQYDSVKAGPSLESPYFRVLTRFMQVKLDVTWDSAQDWTCLYVDDTVWMVLQLPGFHG